jgi:DNA-directed RNA polymerase specialized sigma subunit
MALELKIEDTFTYKQGENKKRDKMILALYKKEKLSIEDIADAAEVSVEYVKNLVKQSEK